MSYYRRSYRSEPRSKIEAERFDALLAKELSDNTRSFIESLRDQNSAKGLTERQVVAFGRVENRYDEDALREAAEWKDEYLNDSEKREHAAICARYYLANPPYFGRLATQVLHEDGFVPSKKQFAALTGNKYALKVIATATEPPPFPVGSMAYVRASHSLVSNRSLHNQLALVTETIARGVYPEVRVLVNGKAYKMEARCLKPLRRKKKKASKK